MATTDSKPFDPQVPGIPGDGTPVLLHTDEARGLTFTWYDISRRKQDWQSRERGYLVSRLVVTDAADREVGYLNVTHTTAEMVAAELPTPFHWADENTGTSFGFGYYDEVSPQRIWASAYQALRTTPPSADGKGLWVISEQDAPTDPDVLVRELAWAEAQFAEQVCQFVRNLSIPFVDYSFLDHTATGPDGAVVRLRGTGIGQLMYVLAAKRLAEQGKVLRASGIQSEEAEALWRRLLANPDVPTREVTVGPQGGQYGRHVVDCIDFTGGLG